MPYFAYQAVSRSGLKRTGKLEASDINEAGDILLGRGLTPITLSASRPSLSLPSLTALRARFGKVSARELILFTKQFATMVRAGMPMLRLFQVLEQQTEKIKLKGVVRDIRERLQNGENLHSAFAVHNEVFSSLYANMIDAGETAGALPEVLERLMYILDHEHKVRSDVRAACRYPIIVVGMLVLAFFVLLTFVIPRFAKIFAEANVTLPLPTRVCLGLHHTLVTYWPLFLLLVAAVVFSYIFAMRMEGGRYLRDRTLLRLPILGPLFIKAAMSRFASIFAILQASGVSILDAMGILQNTIGNAAIAREFAQISDQLVEGRGIAAPLRSARFFPPMVVNMAAIGEESGSLDEMLQEVSSHYDVEVEFATKGLSDAIAPLLTIGLAVVVGFFALAVFLPMWDLAKIVK